jgi:DNA-binding SARP family transcriptional activator
MQSEFNGYIQTFGTLGFYKNGELYEDDFPGAKKSLDIFKYLICNYKRKSLKKEICDIFWPNMSENKAKQNLSSNLYYLRKGLDVIYDKGSFGKFFIRSNSHLCWLNKPLELEYDFEMFESYVTKASEQKSDKIREEYLVKALEFYKGDFFQNANEVWIIAKRKFYKEKVIEVLLDLIEIEKKKSESNLDQYFEKAMKINPTEERVIFEKIKYLSENNDLLGAVNCYREYKKKLVDEYKITSSPKIDEFISSITKDYKVEVVPKHFTENINYVNMSKFQEICAFELRRRDPKSLLLTLCFKDFDETMIDKKGFSRDFFMKIRLGDRVTFAAGNIFVLFSEADKLSLPILINKFFPVFDKYCKGARIKYKWHEVSTKKTNLITYGEWK